MPVSSHCLAWVCTTADRPRRSPVTKHFAPALPGAERRPGHAGLLHKYERAACDPLEPFLTHLGEEGVHLADAESFTRRCAGCRERISPRLSEVFLHGAKGDNTLTLMPVPERFTISRAGTADRPHDKQHRGR